MDQSSINHIKGVVEAILFVSDKPVALAQLKDLVGTEANVIKEVISDLRKECLQKNRGMVIVEIAGGYQMLSHSIYAEHIRGFYKTKQKEKLSKPSLETLAIVAYKQPVTRADVEGIRGVNSDGVMAHLLNKELIKIIGRRDVAGRPYLYGTTKQFLEYFGLKSLNDMPNLEDFPKFDPQQNQEKILPIEDEDIEKMKAEEAEAQDSEAAVAVAVEKINAAAQTAAAEAEEVSPDHPSESGEKNESNGIT